MKWVLLAPLCLGGCVSVHQLPLPDNWAVADNYTRAAAGNAEALRGQAMAYRNGAFGVQPDSDESRRLLLLAAEAGSVPACLDLGWLYAPLDRSRAEYWFSRLAQAGNRAGADALSRLYGDKRYGTPEPVVALGWALVGGNQYLIEQQRKNLSPEQVEEARRQADAWLARYPVVDRKAKP